MAGRAARRGGRDEEPQHAGSNSSGVRSRSAAPAGGGVSAPAPTDSFSRRFTESHAVSLRFNKVINSIQYLQSAFAAVSSPGIIWEDGKKTTPSFCSHITEDVGQRKATLGQSHKCSDAEKLSRLNNLLFET